MSPADGFPLRKSRSRAGSWWRAARFHFVPPSYLPAALGAVVAWAALGRFHLGYFVLTLLGVTFNHVALNMTDDYFDYLHAVDEAKERGGNALTGGSGTLTSGEIAPARMRMAFLLLYGLTAVIGVYLTVVRGWPVLALGLFGVACAYFYAAPPVKYGYLGLGEVSQLVNFSLTIGLGAYFVQAGRLSWQAVFAVLPLGFMMFSMITVNEIPDAREDRRGRKRTLVVRLGVRAAVWLYAAGMIAAFAVVAAGPPLGLTPWWSYLALATIPGFVRSWVVLRRSHHDPAGTAPANQLTIVVHNFSGLLLVAAYLIHGASRGRAVVQLLPGLLLLGLLWAPVAAKMIGWLGHRRPSRR
jgi:1,4-dihydroxy-2-naphthoate polyprenyltransferase